MNDFVHHKVEPKSCHFDRLCSRETMDQNGKTHNVCSRETY